jgi:hypothetical protein
VGLQNVSIAGGARYGLYLKGSNLLIAEASHFDWNMGSGARVEWSGDPAPGSAQFIACTFSQNGDRGCEASNASLLSFLGCVFDGNRGGMTQIQGNGLDASACNRVEILSCSFSNSNAVSPLFQLLFLYQCRASIADACWFDGGPFAGQGAQFGAFFLESDSSRMSNCSGQHLVEYLAVFTSSLDCVEFGNSEIDQTPARISQGPVQRFIGMSRGSTIVAASPDANFATTGLLPGALAWFDSPKALVVWNGTAWKAVSLS